MSPSRPTLPRQLLALIRRLVGRERADAILADREEELARRLGAPKPPRWPRLWLTRRVIGDSAALAWSSLTLGARSQRHILRDAWRSLRSTPGTSLFALLILTVGMAGATVTFSVVDAVVLRPYPFGSGTNLVMLTGPGQPAAAMEYEAWRDGAGSVFDGVAATADTPEILSFGGSSVLLLGAQVSPNLFDVLRTRPLIGRTFTADDVSTGPGRVVIVGYWLWRRYFQGAADVLGRQLPLRDGAATVVGVMPEGFTYPLLAGRSTVDLWTPYVTPPDQTLERAGGVARYSNFRVIGRLKPRVSREQAADAIWAALADVRQKYSNAYAKDRPRVLTIDEAVFGAVRGWMLLVLSSVALLMAIACINVANLLLIRSQVRTRELAIRASLGAGRGHLAVALLVESLVLSITATGLALVLAFWAVGVARENLPSGIVRASTIALDARVLAVVVTTAIANGIIFGLVPAWHASRTDVVSLLKDATPAATPARRRWRSALLIGQVACVSALLVVTTLFVTSFVRIVTADLGFNRANLIDVRLTGPAPSVSTALETLRAVSGVVDVAAVSGGSTPIVGSGWSARMLGRADDQSTGPVDTISLSVSPGYFRTAAIALVAGRTFDAASDQDAVILDSTAARQMFGTTNPIGRMVKNVGITRPFTVIAVTAHVESGGPEAPDVPQAYFLIRDRQTAEFLIRVADHPRALLPAIAGTASRLVPNGGQPPLVMVVDDAFRELTATRRFNAGVMGIFGLLAVLIGAAGVYGVMASIVAQQRRELGVRVALGATATHIERAVLGRASAFLAIGLAIGLPAGWWGSRFFASLLFSVTTSNAATYVIDAAVLLGVGLAAAWLPARRAARVDPIVVLKAS